MHREHLPEDVHPRALIQAIQNNLGITKKEISERTGISYGTLNRYTRTPTSIGRPRRTSIERLRKLYTQSLNRFNTAGGFDSGDSSAHPGAAHRRSLLAGTTPPPPAPRRDPTDPVDLQGMPRDPFLKFLRRLSRYAQADVAHFLRSECRDRTRLLETRELVGDLYLALVSDLVDCAAPSPVSTPSE